MVPTYTVFVPAPAGHAGSVPVKVNGTVTTKDEKGDDVEDRVSFEMDVPFNQKVKGVPEPILTVLRSQFGSDVQAMPETTPAPKAPAAKGPWKPGMPLPPEE